MAPTRVMPSLDGGNDPTELASDSLSLQLGCFFRFGKTLTNFFDQPAIKSNQNQSECALEVTPPFLYSTHGAVVSSFLAFTIDHCCQPLTYLTFFLLVAQTSNFLFITLTTLTLILLNSEMALSSAILCSQVPASVSFKVDRPRLACNASDKNIISQKFGHSLNFKSNNIETLGQPLSNGWSFVRGSIIITRPNLGRNVAFRKSSAVYASWMSCSQIASGAFTLGTAAVLPFYTLMIVAPHADFTKKVAASSLPYVFLGALYGYLLYLSWTPDTMRLMFASKYWLPELPGMAKMFSNEITLASAWIHLLTVDLFAARQVYDDGLQNNIETRHSVSLCLLFCPVGILAHALTKALTRRRNKEKTDFTDDQEAISSDFIK